MKQLTTIINYKLLSWIKLQEKISLASILKNVGTSLIYLLFAVGIYFFTINALAYLMEEVKIGMFLLHRFIFAILFIFFMTVNIGNMVVSYSTFFKTAEVNFLLTKPISFSKIFLIKFFDNFFYSSSTLILMITAALAGYTFYVGLNWYFILIALAFLILPFTLIAGILGVITLLLILRLAASFGIKKVLIVLSFLYAASIIIFYIFASPVQLVTKVFEYFPNLNNYFGFLESPFIKLLPNYWVSDALYWISSGRAIAASWNIYLLITTSILFFILALLLAKKWFYKTWLVFQSMSGEIVSKKKSKPVSFFSFEKKSVFKPLQEALIKRELLLFFREPSQWSHFLVMAFLITIFIVSLSNIDIMILNAYNIYLKTLIYLIIYLFNVFLIASMSLRFIFPLVSLEGDSIWKIRSSPINYKKMMLTRLFIYFTVIFVIGQLLNFVSSYQFSFILSIISQLNTAFVTITLVSLNFGMGSAHANYKEKNPIRVASSQGASITFLFTIIYMIFLILLLFIPLSNYFFSVDSGVSPNISQLLYTNLILAVIALITGYLSISNGIRSFVNDV